MATPPATKPPLPPPASLTDLTPVQQLPGRYEAGDLSLKWTGFALLTMVVLAGLIHWGLWELLKNESAKPRVIEQVRSVAPRPLGRAAPPIQPSQDHDRLPAGDLDTMREGEDRVFSAMGFIPGPDPHTWRIPDDLVRDVARGPDTPVPRPPAATTEPVVTPVPGVDEGGKP